MANDRLYTIVDVAAVNAIVIVKFTNPRYFKEPKNKYRKHFLKNLGPALVMPQREQRAAGNIAKLRTEVTNAVVDRFDLPPLFLLFLLPPRENASFV